MGGRSSGSGKKSVSSTTQMFLDNAKRSYNKDTFIDDFRNVTRNTPAGTKLYTGQKIDVFGKKEEVYYERSNTADQWLLRGRDMPISSDKLANKISRNRKKLHF